MATIANQDIMNVLLSIQKEMKLVAKTLRKVAKVQDDPTGEKATKRSANSGINKPQSISKELANFMGLDKDAKVSRPQAASFIWNYIKDKKLLDDKKIIKDDKKLLSVITIPKDSEVNYIRLQGYIKHHFLKEEEAPESS